MGTLWYGASMVHSWSLVLVLPWRIGGLNCRSHGASVPLWWTPMVLPWDIRGVSTVVYGGVRALWCFYGASMGRRRHGIFTDSHCLPWWCMCVHGGHTWCQGSFSVFFHGFPWCSQGDLVMFPWTIMVHGMVVVLYFHGASILFAKVLTWYFHGMVHLRGVHGASMVFPSKFH